MPGPVSVAGTVPQPKPPPALIVTVVVSPRAADVAVGVLFSATVAEQDAYGNVESADSTTTVTMSAGGGFGCGTVPATLTVTVVVEISADSTLP